ncbi:MAG TPA: wax ester/triacylglycerol synthase family O-acyltransferase [Limnobacter sp.]|uniref:WS/DGAT/MGAT family O-acyltransferase n=1 Tax=Limnobacter sp. TaxID=2003368 RepID=UPI002E351CE8|nr:wax ester/triacylglycerol synthase family O-acyltransferase [Limnobacter sp.]HEX5484918.1 wax ester/triacylglycerol synthase family O-acyltransferase [Limnobacter sp.]
MKALTPNDQLFLWLERRNQPMHVGGLILLDAPGGSSGEQFVRKMVAQMRTYTEAVAPFNQRLVSRLGMWFWDEDPEFDLEAHFFHLSLPKPGRIRELLELVSKLHASQMDRAKPLWEAYLIDGIEDGRVGLYVKVHHALVDGVACMKMLQRSMADSPDIHDMPPFWANAELRGHSQRSAQAEGLVTLLGRALDTTKTQLSSLPKVIKEVARSIWQTSVADPDFVSVIQAPRSVLNQRITASRRFAAQSWSMERIKTCALELEMTLNDVVLAMCGAALRKYLLELDALPARPLVAMVPVSLRRDDSATGNHVALLLANLATDTEDPVERIEKVARSVNDSKQRFANMSQTEIMNYVATMMGISGVNMLTGIAPKLQAFNIVISNVPGPKHKLYFNGAGVDGVYPVSLLLDGQALNITLNSYDGKLEFGLVACRRTLPSMQKLLQFLEEGLQELEAAARIPEKTGVKAKRAA